MCYDFPDTHFLSTYLVFSLNDISRLSPHPINWACIFFSMSYTFTRGLEFCIHELLVFGKATKSDFFSWFLWEWDKRLWELRIGILCVLQTHLTTFSYILLYYYSHTVTGRQYLLTYSTEQSTHVSQWGWILHLTISISCSLNYRACLAYLSEIWYAA